MGPYLDNLDNQDIGEPGCGVLSNGCGSLKGQRVELNVVLPALFLGAELIS